MATRTMSEPYPLVERFLSKDPRVGLCNLAIDESDSSLLETVYIEKEAVISVPPMGWEFEMKKLKPGRSQPLESVHNKNIRCDSPLKRKVYV